MILDSWIPEALVHVPVHGGVVPCLTGILSPRPTCAPRPGDICGLRKTEHCTEGEGYLNAQLKKLGKTRRNLKLLARERPKGAL